MAYSLTILIKISHKSQENKKAEESTEWTDEDLPF